MARVWWLAGIVGLFAVALLIAVRGEASASSGPSASTNSAGCEPTEAFIPAFCLDVPSSSVRRDTTVPLVTLPSQRADVRVETTVPGADAAGLAADVDGAVAHVESLFGRPFRVRPRVLVFGTASSFGQGARE